MKAARAVQFGILFLVLMGFTVTSADIFNPRVGVARAISDLPKENKDMVYVSVESNAFDTKVLSFLKEEAVCALTPEQAASLSGLYEFENREFDVDGNIVDVLYLKGNPINRNMIEESLGITFEGSCNVVHGNKVIALVTPVFVS